MKTIEERIAQYQEELKGILQAQDLLAQREGKIREILSSLNIQMHRQLTGAKS